MTNWYIFFVLTGWEQHIVNRMKQFYDKETLKPFVPMREMFFKSCGKVHKEMKVMFPGYVFIESELCSTDFLQKTNCFIQTSRDIIKILRYGDSDEIAIRVNECVSLRRFLNLNYCIETSTGFIEGDRVYIESGPLTGGESKICKINRHKMEALIDLEIMGGYRQIAIGLEVLRKL